MLQKIIEEVMFDKVRRSKKEQHAIVTEKCKEQGLNPPSYSTFIRKANLILEESCRNNLLMNSDRSKVAWVKKLTVKLS